MRMKADHRQHLLSVSISVIENLTNPFSTPLHVDVAPVRAPQVCLVSR